MSSKLHDRSHTFFRESITDKLHYAMDPKEIVRVLMKGYICREELDSLTAAATQEEKATIIERYRAQLNCI